MTKNKNKRIVVYMDYYYHGATCMFVTLKNDDEGDVEILNPYGEIMHIATSGSDLAKYLQRLSDGLES